MAGRELEDATLFLAVIDCAMERSSGWLDDLLVHALAATSDDEVFRYAVLLAGARHRDELIDDVVRRLDGTIGARKLAVVQESRAGR